MALYDPYESNGLKVRCFFSWNESNEIPLNVNGILFLYRLYIQNISYIMRQEKRVNGHSFFFKGLVAAVNLLAV